MTKNWDYNDQKRLKIKSKRKRKQKKKETVGKIDYTDYGPEKVAVIPVTVKSSNRKIKVSYGAVECVLRSIRLINDSKRAKELLEDMIEICYFEIDCLKKKIIK